MSYVVQLKCSDWSFCAETCVKMLSKTHETGILCQIVTKKNYGISGFLETSC